MPFGHNCEFPDFDSCVSKMRGKVDDAEAFCGALMRDTEGNWRENTGPVARKEGGMLHVDGQDFEVKLTPEAIEPRSFLGQTNEATNVIAIDGTMPKSRQDEVMLHEMIHLASALVPEELVHDVGIRLYGMLREHGLLEEGELIDAMVSGTMSKEEMEALNKDARGPVLTLGRKQRVSEVAWDRDFTRFTSEEWERSCLIHCEEQHTLPVREPNGLISRNACHIAVGLLLRGGNGISERQIRSAARALIRIYKNELEEEPPQDLRDMVGE